MAAAVPQTQQQHAPAANNNPPAPTVEDNAMDEDSDDSSDDDNHAEDIQLLRDQVNQLNAYLADTRQELANTTALIAQQAAIHTNLQAQAATAVQGREPGQLLKPPPPEMFDRTQDQLQGFVTQLQVYFNYFPITLGTEERK
ncbi:hypothetical protein V2G26_009387, partial [Clonostachys chloroleuca]